MRSLPLLATLPFAALAAAQNFSVTLSQSSGNQPRGIAVADFDRDGQPDILMPTGNSDSLAVALRDGAGGFASPLTFPSSGLYPYDVRVGDLNQDGFVDAVTVHRDSNDLAVYMGDGTGGFGIPTTFGVGTGPRTVRLAYVNQDPVLDAVVANFGSGDITILFGDGAGSFGTSVTYPVKGTPFSLDVGDLNGDGNVDIVATGRNVDEISVLLNLGGGFLDSPRGFSVPSPDDVALADFNGDGVLDAATANPSGGTAHVLLGDGTGGFGPATAMVGIQGNPTRMITGDFNGDGHEDIATADAGDTVSLIHGDGTGAFAPAVTISAGGGATVEALVSADMNLDGFLDLVVASRFNHQMRVLTRVATPPPGVANFGEGTPNCTGFMGITANDPTIGNTEFAVRTTNGPQGGGVAAMVWGGPANVVGYDPVGIGVKLHVGPGLLNSVLMPIDSAGNGHAPFPLTGSPSLQGLVFFAQGVHLNRQACGPNSVGVSTTGAVEILIR